jgi:hypothetical protein
VSSSPINGTFYFAAPALSSQVTAEPPQQLTNALPTQKPVPVNPNENGKRFDGTWLYSDFSTNCGGRGSGSWVVTDGVIIGKRGAIGRISSDGDYNSTAVGNDGVVVTSIGKMSGNSGGGSFRRADGCVGRWTAQRS